MEITGNILFIGEQKDVSTTDNPFVVQPFAIQSINENNGMVYENNAGFQATGKNIDILEKLNIGDEVKVIFGLSGTVKSKKDTIAASPKNPDCLDCFTNLRVGRIDLIKANTPGAIANTTPPPSSTPQTTSQAAPDSSDDLPF